MRFESQWSPAMVRAVRQLTPAVREFEIVPSTGVSDYSSGSHINVGVVANGQPEIRSYSLVGQHPVDGAYRIAVNFQKDSRGGSRYVWGLAPGGRISITNPQNLFELTIGFPHYLLIAGGIGVTPLVGMAERLANMDASFYMLYCGRSRADMAYLDQLDQLLGNRLQLAIKDEGSRADLAKVFAPLPAKSEVYFCGPMRMLEDARSIWSGLKRPAANFRFETFGSSGQFAREAFCVDVRDRGKTVRVPEDMTMLDALESAGVPIMSDCKRGECGLCVVDVLALGGQIDHRDVFLSQEEKREGGKICVCVSRVVHGSVTIDSGFRGTGVASKLGAT